MRAKSRHDVGFKKEPPIMVTLHLQKEDYTSNSSTSKDYWED